MKMLIEVTTGSTTTSMFQMGRRRQRRVPTTATKDRSRDLLMQTRMKQKRLPVKLITDYGNDHMFPQAWFIRIEVHYPDGEHPSESIYVDQTMMNNNKSITYFYEKEIKIDANRIVILKDDE